MKPNTSTITHPAQGIDGMEAKLICGRIRWTRVQPWPVIEQYEEEGRTITRYAPGYGFSTL